MDAQNCAFCEHEGASTKTPIKAYTHWRIELYTSQYYLGRCAIILNRHIEDLFDISEQEQLELFSITKQLRNSIKQAFETDMLNYASQGNVVPHVHLHIIPRYKNPVNFAGITFTDERWGQNYAPYNKQFTIPDTIYPQIKDEILKYLHE